jgi:translocation and assembly module TamB
MRRPWKIVIGTLGVLLVIALVAIVSALYVARSGWLREKVRERVVAEAERATGGRVEIGKFLFDWTTLTAEFDQFVIHGTEPAGSPPLLKVEKLSVGFKIISLMKQDFDILFAHVESPQAYLTIAADGSTNLPNPKVPAKSDKSGVETILDLKIGEFALLNGSVEVHAAGQPRKVASYDLAGKNLQSRLGYRMAGPGGAAVPLPHGRGSELAGTYSGTISVQPLDVRYGDYRPVQLSVELALALEKNRLQITSAKVSTPGLRVDLSGELNDFAAPVIQTRYDGEISLAELGSILRLKSRQSGAVKIAGNLRYAGASDFLADGKLSGRNISYSAEGFKLSNASAASSFQAGPKTIELTRLTANLLGASVSGKAVIHEMDRYEITGQLANFDVAKVSSSPLPYDGIASGPFNLSGRFSDRNFAHIAASAKLDISPAESGVPIHGAVDAKYDAGHGQIVLAPSYIAWPNTRLDLSGVPGQRMQVVLESRDLNDLLPAAALAGLKEMPVTLKDGSVKFDGSVIGPLSSPRLEGHISGKNFIYSGQIVDSLDSGITAQESGLTLRGASLVYQKVRATFQGSVGLHDWKVVDTSALTANANLQNASLAGLLALAGRKDLPLTGSVSTSASLAGTIGDPQATANFSVSNGSAYSEPFDRVTGKVDFAEAGVEVLSAQWKAGPKEINVSARYQHAPDNLQTGKLSFQIASNRMGLSQFATVKKEEPGLAGNITLNTRGEVSIVKATPQLTSLDGDLQTTGLTLDARVLSDLKLSVRTEAGSLKTHLESNLAHAEISGDGTWKIGGDYPGTAKLTFAKVDLAIARKLLMPSATPPSFTFGGAVEGNVTIAGSLLKPASMTAYLEVPRLEFRPDVSQSLAKELADITIRNTQPIRVGLANSSIRVESARFAGPNTDVSLLGSINLKEKEGLHLTLNGNVDLKLARTFNPDLDSSGNLLVRVTINGSFDHPQLGGLADLRNGNFSMAGLPNGLSKANGRITFDENQANVEQITAETGGGTIRIAGFAAFGGPSVAFRWTGIAKGVRVRYPEGVSSVSDANLTWTGSTERSVLAGDVTVYKVTYNQQSDTSSLLSITDSGPAPTQAAPTGLLGGTQFDVRVQTAPDITLQTGLISGLQTEANLRLRGTAANPSLLGRIMVSSGTINFLGNKYVINEGTISFFNPVRIEPIVDVDLSTQTQGVDVTLSISGPLTKLSMTYRSDPPLQFSDIVGLLAAGKTPSDPTIAARQTDTQQNWQQLGATALIGQAISNPVSGRLQRFFGVSKLKIDPLLPGLGGAGSSTGGSNPGARLSVEQQVGPNVTFDYVISTNSTSSQVVRLEWAFNKNWSVVILREENSAFGIDFQYKKRFK